VYAVCICVCVYVCLLSVCLCVCACACMCLCVIVCVCFWCAFGLSCVLLEVISVTIYLPGSVGNAFNGLRYNRGKIKKSYVGSRQ
jgi:hypothetical protein